MTVNASQIIRGLAVAQLCALTALSSAYAQQAPKENSSASADTKTQLVPETRPSSSTSPMGEETITLTPFEVVADETGYFSANTQSGTRFNTKLEDLAASVSVMTKEQMSDFAMLDINDIFNYVGNAEGTGSYTDYTVDRNGQVTDNVQVNPTMANRVRGIGAANVSFGNYEVMGRMPVDPLTMEGVEISRGPNANVFGLGNAAGTVNQVPISANLNRNFTRSLVRVDDLGGYRTTLDLNRYILKGKLAIRANAGFQHDEFVRKPSGVNTVRYNGSIKYQPFKNTRISGTILHYRMNGNRPNFTPPRDYISSWIAAGSPSWDPINQVIHINGQTYGNGGLGTTTPITSDSNVPRYMGRAGAFQSRGNISIDNGTVAYWSPNAAQNSTAVTPTPLTNNISVRLMQSTLNLGTVGASPGRYTDQPLFTTTPVVSDKSIYDWSEINLASVNRVMDKTDVYNVEVDQLILNTPRQMLSAQAGVFREDSMRYQRLPLGNAGISGQTGQLYIDVNETNLDGSVNQFFGHPYIGVAEPLTRWNPAKWDTYRMQLAYKLDLTHEKSWMKYLGVHQVSGYDEYKYRINRQYSFREALSSSHTWTNINAILPGQARANQSNVTGGPQSGPNLVRGYFKYYVGDGKGYNIDYAPSDYSYGDYNFTWGGYKLTNGLPVAGSSRFTTEPATLGLLATTDGTGGNNNLKQIIKTRGGLIQSTFMDNSLITTFGLREDKVYSLNGATPVGLTNGNTTQDYDCNDRWAAGPWRYNVGKTKTTMFVVRPFRNLGFVNKAANGNSGFLGFVADVARNLSLTYNRADNFVPQSPAIDLFLNQLPNTTGQTREYGFWLPLADNKFVLRFNHYSTKQLNDRNGDANTVAQRILRADLDVSGDAFQLEDRATAWVQLLHPTYTSDQVKSAVSDIMHIPLATMDALKQAFTAGTIAATNDTESTGNEIELNFNPNKYWTLNGSVTETKAVSTNISNTVQQWIDQRMPIWTTIVDPITDPNLGTGQSQGWVATADNPQHLWRIHNYGGSQTAAQNFATFVDAPYSVIKQLEGKSKPSVRKYNVKLSTSYQLAGITNQKILKNVKVGTSIRWEDKGAIGYYGLQSLPATITQLDASRPIYDKAHYYFDFMVGYKTKLWADKVLASFQFNVRNIQEHGRLQPIGAFPDGTPHSYRIVDPRQFILTASFDL
jgi:hypothetical protein